MNSILVYIFLAATALSASVTFGQGNANKNNANIFTVTSASMHTRRRVPRGSDSIQSINSRLTPHQGFMKWSDISFDLMPAAQSYFIEPETPSTTTIKPTFKRRKTLRPISSLTEKKKKTPANFDGGFADNPENPNQVPFNPFRQIVNTGFAKKRPSPQPSLRSKIRATQLDNPDQNNYEINEVITTTEGQEPTPTEITPSTTATGSDHKPFSRSHLPQGAGRRKKIQPTAATPQIRIDRPNRFASPRRSFKTSAAPPASKTTETQTEATQTSSTTLSTNSRSSNRGGRQGFILRPKAPTPQSPSENETEASKPLRRRKKTSTEPSASSSASPTPTLETFRLPNPFEEQAQSNDVPTARKAPSGPTDASHRRNPGLQRRPGPGFKSKQLPPSDAANHEQIAHTSEDNLDGQNQVAVDKSVSMRMRARRPGRAGAPVVDSVHESSDSVAAVVAPAEEQHDDAVVISSNSETPAEPTEAESYKPRMLSNRRPNPLDKLTNRQAAARRFLTPKKTTEQSTTAAPVTPAGTKAVRKPFSLQNLRNRRVGPLGASSTTTEAPQEVPAAAEEGADDAPQPDAVSGNDKAEDLNAEPKPDDDTPAGETSDPAETPNEPEVPAAPGPLGNKRPLLPGNRRPVMPRVPLKSKVTPTTTVKPTNEVTTTAPTCEEGKRYNKILRKCIPSYNPRSG